MENYTVKKVIGEGAYGRAVLCQDNKSGQLVVIKEIAMKNLSLQEQRDAKKETTILASLHHPNIIGYKGSFMKNNVLHIIMDYADNGDLFAQIQKAKGTHFKEDQILDWFVQICLALKHIHDRKILHRDIKCQNIFLMKNGMIKMGDFGIAKILDHTGQLSKTAIGTPYYLSPEICQGKSYNAKSDVWSLGCVLYELCTLNHAFDSNCMNGLIMKILRSRHSPIPYTYSQNLRSLVDSLLDKDQRKRPSVNQILRKDFIKARINNLLSKTIQKIEFSHTVFHGVKGGITPEAARIPPPELPVISEEPQKREPVKLPTPRDEPPKPPKFHANEFRYNRLQPKIDKAVPKNNYNNHNNVANAPNPIGKARLKNPTPRGRARQNRKYIIESRQPLPSCLPKPRYIKQMPRYAHIKAYERPKPSRNDIAAQKNIAIVEERRQKEELKRLKEEKVRLQAEKDEKRRQELLEKRRKQKEEREANFKKAQQEAAKQRAEFDKLVAPFKQKQAAAGVARFDKGKRPYIDRQSPRSDNQESNKHSGDVPKAARSESNDNKVAPSHNLVPKSARSVSEEPKPHKVEYYVKKVEPRPGRVPDAIEERNNLREFIKQRRAQVRQQNAAKNLEKQQDDQTPKSDNEKADSNDDSEPTELDMPKPVIPDNHEEQHKVKKSLEDLVPQVLSDDDDEPNESKDLMELAAIAQDIINNNDEEEQEEETESVQPQPGKFIFNNRELILENVSNDDTLGFRIEVLRCFIEEGIGSETFLEIYEFFTQHADNMSDHEIDHKIKQILKTPEQLMYYPLLNQLIACEELHNSRQML